MDLKEIDRRKIVHIDTSGKLYTRQSTGIAYRIINTKQHKGLALSLKLKKELERDLNSNLDYARIYAICIYYLIKDDLDLFDLIFICEDEDFFKVKKYLDILFQNDRKYVNKEIKSIFELRKISGNKRIVSSAHNLANSYRKRALKSYKRKQTGILLNTIRVTYKMIKEKWFEIENKIR